MRGLSVSVIPILVIASVALPLVSSAGPWIDAPPVREYHSDPTRSITVVLYPDPPVVTRPLVTGLATRLYLQGLPASSAYRLTDAKTGGVVAAGVADVGGLATVGPFAPPATDALVVASGPLARTLPVRATLPPDPLQTLMDGLVPLAPESVGGHPPGPGGGGVCTTCDSREYGDGAGTQTYDTYVANFGNWRGTYRWLKVNDADPRQRYLITISKVFGTGFSNSAPYHLFTDTAHRISTSYGSTATFIADWEPVHETRAFMGDSTFSVGAGGPSFSYSWKQSNQAGDHTSDVSNGHDWSRADYYGDTTFVRLPPDDFTHNGGPWFKGELQYAAEEVFPADAVWAYSEIGIIHQSCDNSFCIGGSHDDAEGHGTWINWS